MTVEGEHVAGRRVLGFVGATRVGDDPHHPTGQLSRFGEDRDHVVVALAHLPSISSQDHSGSVGDDVVGQFEDVAVGGVEGGGNVAGDLDVLTVVDPNGDQAWWIKMSAAISSG